MAEVQAIPKREEWDSLPTKQDRKDMMALMRKEYPDKEIREAWGMTPGSFYNLLHRYGLAGKGAETADDAVQSGETGEGRGNGGKRGPGRPKGSGKGKKGKTTGRKGNFIDAEYRVIEDERSDNPPATPPAASAEDRGMALAPLAHRGEAVDLPFPTIKGKTAQLRKQFEAIVMFLEGHADDEEARFEIALSVTKSK